MEHAFINDIEPNAFGSDVDHRGLAGPLDASNIALNQYHF